MFLYVFGAWIVFDAFVHVFVYVFSMCFVFVWCVCLSDLVWSGLGLVCQCLKLIKKTKRGGEVPQLPKGDGLFTLPGTVFHLECFMCVCVCVQLSVCCIVLCAVVLCCVVGSCLCCVVVC